jgi:hypothetical protein
MRIGVLGTGMVGRTIGSRLVGLGHEVKMGSGTFADAAAFGELNFNCTSGGASLEALRAAGAENLAGKILVDVANALDRSRGMPPTLSVANTNSLGEQIQSAFPEAKVVKTLNTMNCEVLVEPSKVPREHDAFVCGNDQGAKAQVAGLLESFGWPPERIIDIGDITARGPELYVPLWPRLWGVVGGPHFNIKVVR